MKIVSCRDGEVVITAAPKRGVGNLRPQLIDPSLSILTETPQRPPLVTRNVPTSKTP
jgi:hypothetical protein